MPRIRTLKPEFWDSPSTGQADLAPRLAFMAMWNWADDSGRGTANLKNLEAFCFPHDTITELPRKGCGNSADGRGGWRNFAEVCGEVAEAYGVVFYRVKGRDYYWIPSFADHQSRDFRKSSRYPTAEEGYILDIARGVAASETPDKAPHSEASADSRGNSADSRVILPAGTGEQRNRGTGIVGESGDSPDDTPPPNKNDRDDILEVIEYLDQKMLEYDPEARTPSRTVGNLDAARLLLDKDGRTTDQVKAAIDYSQDSEFWRPNIRSMTKLRDKYETLRAQAISKKNGTRKEPAPTGSLLADDERLRKAYERPDYLTATDHL